MRAAFITETGPPEVIRVGELPAPTGGPTDVLVAVDLVSANPVDAFIRSGRYVTRTPFPFVVGRDLVGSVSAAGAGSGFGEGERVWCNSLGHDGRQGSYAEFAVVPAERCYRLPPDADAATVVAVAHPAATAYLAWFVHAQLRPGEVVYVGGGAGNVGSAAVVLAAEAGATVIASAGARDLERCRHAGAHVVVDYRDPQLAQKLAEAAPGGIDVFWDTSGHHDFSLATSLVRPGGRVLLTAAASQVAELPVAELYTRDVSIHAFVISRAHVEDLAAAAARINGLVAAGALTARISEIVPLAAATDVHARLDVGRIDGRVLLHP